MRDSRVATVFHSKLVRTLLPAIAGFLGYGGWAFFCNFRHGLEMGIQSGLVQGSISFVITLTSNFIMEAIYCLTGGKLVTRISAIVLIVGTSFGINVLAGTPEVLWTIAPGSIMGAIYVFGYVSTLSRSNRVGARSDTGKSNEID